MHKPQLYKARTWACVRKHYSGFEAHEPMFRLVEQIASSPYANGLYPSTSHLMLIIGQTLMWEWEHDVLYIEYDPAARQFTFTFWERPDAKPWVTHCSSEEGFQRFEKCIAVKRIYQEQAENL